MSSSCWLTLTLPSSARRQWLDECLAIEGKAHYLAIELFPFRSVGFALLLGQGPRLLLPLLSLWLRSLFILFTRDS